MIDERQERMDAAMVDMYGAVAAMIRRDRVGTRLLLADLRREVRSTTELLVAISFATLQRLEAAFEQRSLRTQDRPLAGEIVRTAVEYGAAPASAVHAAAWRLDAVRRNDRRRARRDVHGSRRVADDEQLVAGAVALLASTVELAAACAGDPAEVAAQQLCLAASMRRTA
jgi:hypothetical protein